MNYCNQKQDYVKADKPFFLVCRLFSCYQADGRLPEKSIGQLNNEKYFRNIKIYGISFFKLFGTFINI